MNVVSGQGILSALAGEESGQQWDEISNYLFQILGNVIESLLMKYPLSIQLVIYALPESKNFKGTPIGFVVYLNNGSKLSLSKIIKSLSHFKQLG